MHRTVYSVPIVGQNILAGVGMSETWNMELSRIMVIVISNEKNVGTSGCNGAAMRQAD